MSSPPSKRRRTSSPRLAAAAPPRVESPAASSPPTRSRSRSRSRSHSSSPDAPPRKRRNPLEGFNESDEDVPRAGPSSDRRAGEATVLAEAAQDNDNDEEEEEHCAICLSPIENRVSLADDSTQQVVFDSELTEIPFPGALTSIGGRLAMPPWTVLLGLYSRMDGPEPQGEIAPKGRSHGGRSPADATQLDSQCPLCLGPIEHLIHNIRSTKDYQIHYLLPLHTIASTTATTTAEFGIAAPGRARPRHAVNPTLPRHALYGRSRYSSSARVDERDESTWREREEERALERRRYIYREGLYAKHVASNRYTGFKPFTPQTFANNADLKAKVIKFIRREVGASGCCVPRWLVC